MTIDYRMDKETKSTYRFTPAEISEVGVATIYLPKKFCEKLGINPQDGARITIEPKEGK